VNLPRTLHSQLFLLAYDRRHQTFDGDRRWCFGFALRAAMLSDLYLAGHLEDENDEGHALPRRLASFPPLVLCCTMTPSAGYRRWWVRKRIRVTTTSWATSLFAAFRP
jgi:hypothetical protein